jgi:DNA modification methylase
LQSKKRYDYLIWKKIVLMVNRNEHYNGKRHEVIALVKLLREVREYRVGREKVFKKLLMRRC